MGLALDIVDLQYQSLDEAQEQTNVQQWLAENAGNTDLFSGTKEKSDVTGIVYEPWHYRYVGKDSAREIYEQNICLEEYLALIDP